jgi:alpha-glucosidase (family GH31 glycosyl hydrolase)
VGLRFRPVQVIDLLPDEHWWGGAVSDGQIMPFGHSEHQRDLAHNAGAAAAPNHGPNQSAPLLLSDQGRVVWSESPFAFRFIDGRLELDTHVDLVQAGASGLRNAFRLASQQFFPPMGEAPADEMFSGPQYNVWIEMPYSPTQARVLGYARGLIDAGFPPGVLMIDDIWAPDYGDWRFDPARFPDPGAMVHELHGLGFRVMVWTVPFVSPDGPVFRELRTKGLLLRDAHRNVAMREWWNGYSAVLDLSNPAAIEWYDARLQALVHDVGIDGFKFDAGDLRDFRDDDLAVGSAAPVDQCQAWSRLGTRYPFNEFRASWKAGGWPLAQRLHDKPATAWDEGGLASLIPEGIVQGLLGYSFNCPDMVGGGAVGTFAPGAQIDQELFVRYAQCSALFPMVQFSLAPHRVLDHDHLSAVKSALTIRQRLLPELLDLVNTAARTGEPILRPLAYHYDGYSHVSDQFLLGENVLVAPVLEPGATQRVVEFPPGDWEAPDGLIYTEGKASLGVDLHSLPWFRRRPR